MMVYELIKTREGLKTFWAVHVRRIPPKDYHLEEFIEHIRRGGGMLQTDPLFFMALKVCEHLGTQPETADEIARRFHGGVRLFYTTDRNRLDWINVLDNIQNGDDFFECFSAYTGYSRRELHSRLGDELYNEIAQASVLDAALILYDPVRPTTTPTIT